MCEPVTLTPAPFPVAPLETTLLLHTKSEVRIHLNPLRSLRAIDRQCRSPGAPHGAIDHVVRPFCDWRLQAFTNTPAWSSHTNTLATQKKEAKKKNAHADDQLLSHRTTTTKAPENGLQLRSRLVSPQTRARDATVNREKRPEPPGKIAPATEENFHFCRKCFTEAGKTHQN